MLGGINIITTIINMRAPGMTLHKMPLFVWAMLFQSIIIVLAMPVLAGKFVPALNLAVSWEIFFKDYREVTQIFSTNLWNPNDCAPELLKIIIFPIFGSYLAGLIEGDGTIIIIPKAGYPSVQITFPLKDFPLCQIIQKELGHGSISKVKKSAAYTLSINNLQGLSGLINGKIRGSKYHQFVLLVNYLNQKSKNFNITPIISQLALSQDNWLTGFIEADGSFQVRASLTAKNPRVSLSFELTQSRITRYGYNTLDIINIIAEFLEVNVEFIRSDRKYPQYRIRTSSIKTNGIIQKYLIKYPLKGSKYIDFSDWNKVFYFFEKSTHKENIMNIIKIKSQINQGRTWFNWDHL